MKKNKKEKMLLPCSVCGKRHYMSFLPCPSCGNLILQHVSEKVSEKCYNSQEVCEICDAYNEHLDIYG